MYSKIWIFLVVLLAQNTNALSAIEEMHLKKHYEKVATRVLNEFTSVKMKNEANVRELLRFFLAQRVRQELNMISWTLRLG
jgi:hypothetical protein